MNDTQLETISYGPKVQKVSVLVLLCLLACASPSLLHNGLNNYAVADSTQSLLQMKAIRQIFCGGIGVLLFIPITIQLIARRIMLKPKLTLTPNQIIYQGMTGKIKTYEWKNLEAFQRVPADVAVKPLFLATKIIEPIKNEGNKVETRFMIPSNILDVETYNLLNEINRFHAASLGREFIPQPQSIAEIKQEQKSKEKHDAAIKRRNRGFWFSGVLLSCIFLSFIGEIIFRIPKHPYENYSGLGSFIIALLVYILKR